MTMKKCLLGLMSFWFCLSSVVMAEEAMRNIEFFQRIVSDKEGLLFEGSSWMKNGQVCVEFEAGGNLYTSIIKDGKVYNFTTASSKGTISPFKKSPQMQFGPEILQSKAKMDEFLTSVNAQKLREETFQEQLCDVYQYTHNEGQTEVLNTLWIWQKGQVPLKAEMKIGDMDQITIYYDNIKINGEIPDKRFIIPEQTRFKAVS